MSFVHTFRVRPYPRADDTPWAQVRVEGSATEDGTYTTHDTVDLDPLDTDPSEPQVRTLTFTSSLEDGWFALTFLDSGGDESPTTDPIFDGTTAPAFASTDDVATRLGRSLTAAEEAQIEGVLEAVDGMIRDAVDRDIDWAPVPVPSLLREVSIQKAIAALTNPPNIASESLGEYSVTFQRGQDGGIALSEAEGRMLRLAVYGTNTASSYPRSVVDRFIDLAEDRDVDEPYDDD
jgi:hypothetical protein